MLGYGTSNEVMREFKTKNFRVVADALPEDDLDLSWDDTGETKDGLESGRYIAFVARVRVFYRGREVGTDYLGNCIYKSLNDFMDHRQCGAANEKRFRREGKFQIYRKNRPSPYTSTNKDKLKARGFKTRERAQQWAKANAKEEYEILESVGCGSYFHDMIRSAISEARKSMLDLSSAYIRRVA